MPKAYPPVFCEGMISGKKFFRMIFAIVNSSDLPYIMGWNMEKEELIRKIQEYADGVYFYVPRKPGNRHKWGQATNYKAELKARNDRIRSDYAAGISVTALSQIYHLSEKSIRRILHHQ